MNGITQQRAKEAGIPAQGEHESDDEFKNRVSGALRDMGHIIEAHEAFTDMLYDDPNQGPLGPMTGIIGASAKALHHIDYGSSGNKAVGDDIAAGIVSQTPKEEIDPLAAMLIMAMMKNKK